MLCRCRGGQKELLGVLFVGEFATERGVLGAADSLAGFGRGGGGFAVRVDVELVGRGASDSSGAETGGRRAGSGGRKLERASERERAG